MAMMASHCACRNSFTPFTTLSYSGFGWKSEKLTTSQRTSSSLPRMSGRNLMESSQTRKSRCRPSSHASRAL